MLFSPFLFFAFVNFGCRLSAQPQASSHVRFQFEGVVTQTQPTLRTWGESESQEHPIHLYCPYLSLLCLFYPIGDDLQMLKYPN